MFKHILVTLDGSAYSERVLSYVADLAALVEARVTLLTVVPDSTFPSEAKAAGGDAPSADVYRTYLDRHATMLRAAGVADVSTALRAGVAARVIVQAARELAADLVAMSTQGVSADSDEGLGGVASKVLMAAPCPVFMVRIVRPEPPRTPAEATWQAEGGANVG